MVVRRVSELRGGDGVLRGAEVVCVGGWIERSPGRMQEGGEGECKYEAFLCVGTARDDDAENADRKLPAAETRGVACEQPPQPPRLCPKSGESCESARAVAQF